ncbi:hypothetical protein AJ78_03902 [Emergomyces pasteurianus Ep9510]|uniref:Uncharacterized protein n=1 Tax=Emergomyces pasteurianus Ep9510 TaxID=1447872 RepID=A0A1J9QJ17_9EURO|nr:hypothetical protein AJ78_03902 [Emergomyces pasteurianus Ep9510]
MANTDHMETGKRRRGCRPWHGAKNMKGKQQELGEAMSANSHKESSARIEQLWASGAHIYKPTVLHEAVRQNHREMVKTLLPELGACRLQLASASSYGCIGIIQLLINHGADAGVKKCVDKELLPIIRYESRWPRKQTSSGFFGAAGADISILSSIHRLV